MNYKDSFYKGLGEGFETVSVHVPLTYVLNMRHLLTEERWEAKELSAKGIIYRLKPEFIPAAMGAATRAGTAAGGTPKQRTTNGL